MYTRVSCQLFLIKLLFLLSPFTCFSPFRYQFFTIYCVLLLYCTTRKRKEICVHTSWDVKKCVERRKRKSQFEKFEIKSKKCMCTSYLRCFKKPKCVEIRLLVSKFEPKPEIAIFWSVNWKLVHTWNPKLPNPNIPSIPEPAGFKNFRVFPHPTQY